MAETTSSEGSWAEYYSKTGTRPPRKTLVFALDRFDEAGRPQDPFAVDMGCGSGRDTVELLRRNWRVMAVDSAPEAIEMLLRRSDLQSGVRSRIRPLVSTFEDAVLPPSNLVNASFALPLCAPSSFPTVWAGIRKSLRSGGRFSGQLYGDRDSWSGRSGMTCHDRTSVETLLHGLDVEFFEEEEEDSVTPRGTAKHWHIFHIVARKP